METISTAERSCLSGDAIFRHYENGRIFILPFDRRNLGTSQYDVRLGPYYFRENVTHPSKHRVFNIFHPDDVDHMWGKEWHTALAHTEWAREENGGRLLENIGAEERIMVLEPGETVLAHTLEFIGGNDNRITTKMQARSSLGRSCIEVCKCAGMGDIGFCNRWTMEITNNSRSQRIPLIVGMRVAQLVFFETEGVGEELLGAYRATRKYQGSDSLKDMVRNWHPETMKPKLYKDWEIREGGGYRRFEETHAKELERFLNGEVPMR